MFHVIFHVLVHYKSKVLAGRIFETNMVNIKGDGIGTPDYQCHPSPIPGG